MLQQKEMSLIWSKLRILTLLQLPIILFIIMAMFVIRILFRELMYIALQRPMYGYRGFSTKNIEDTDQGIAGIIFICLDFLSGILILYYFFHISMESARNNSVYVQTQSSTIISTETNGSYLKRLIEEGEPEPYGVHLKPKLQSSNTIEFLDDASKSLINSNKLPTFISK